MAEQLTQLEQQLFGYDAVKTSTRRRAPSREMRSEDNVLRHHDRDRMVATARDAQRNWTLCGWMVRKHIDFVADFGFQANTPDDAFNKRLTKLVRMKAKRGSVHVSGRHPLRRLMRIQESCRVLDGDVLFEKMRNGTLNMIRADQIRNPSGTRNSREWINGVRLSRTKAPIEYAIHQRNSSGRYTLDKMLPARNAIINGYWDSDPDQIRGISRLITAINPMRDIYEGFDFALARMKIEQLFGTVITRERSEAGNPFAGNRQFDEAEDDDTEEELAARADAEDKSGRVDFGGGPFQVELAEGEDMKIIAGNMPSSNFQRFVRVCIEIVLKSLDIPTSFFDESFTNYYGQRGALQQYKRSAASKQADNADVLDEITQWWIIGWIVDGVLELPRGWTLDDIDYAWVPRGIPWWDRSKEIIGDIRAIAAGLDNPENVCLDHGQATPFENIDKTQKVLAYAHERLGPYGVRLNFDPSQTQLEQIEEVIASAND